ADFTYKRNNDKNVSLKWVRKLTNNSFHVELNLQSHYEKIPSARVYADASFSKGFKLDAGVEWSKKISLSIEMSKKKIVSNLSTPFPGYENVHGVIEYNLSGKSKSVSLEYERGERKANVDINVTFKSKKEGTLHIEMNTPFENLKHFEIDASWKNRNANVKYTRNDVQYTFNGNADVKSDKTSFDISFTPVGKSPIRIAASYDLKKIIAGTGRAPETLAAFNLEFDGNSMESIVK
ncbi:unnamed protein product, partial [Meganyctiphanes norvegica]